MALADAVQDARLLAQRITWQDEDGTAVNLTGYTLTGRIEPEATGIGRAIDGDLDLVTPASGLFDWTYGATDVGTAGKFLVQFIATSGENTKTFEAAWTVRRAL